jgi:transcriptional regulator
MAKQDVLQGTLDLLILKSISLDPTHGYGILLRIEQLSGGKLQILQGSLYPALYRLETRGLIVSEWGESENNRRAKYYRLTAQGRRQLREQMENWDRLSSGVAGVLNAEPEQL